MQYKVKPFIPSGLCYLNPLGQSNSNRQNQILLRSPLKALLES